MVFQKRSPQHQTRRGWRDRGLPGHRPVSRHGEAGPLTFPDPTEASQEIDKVRVPTLPQWIQRKLAARRYYDFGDVVFLIRTHNLDESFLRQMHPSVHKDFIECLEEKRRADESLARAE